MYVFSFQLFEASFYFIFFKFFSSNNLNLYWKSVFGFSAHRKNNSRKKNKITFSNPSFNFLIVFFISYKNRSKEPIDYYTKERNKKTKKICKYETKSFRLSRKFWEDGKSKDKKWKEKTSFCVLFVSCAINSLTLLNRLNSGEKLNFFRASELIRVILNLGLTYK